MSRKGGNRTFRWNRFLMKLPCIVVLLIFSASCTNEISLPSKETFIKFYGGGGYDHLSFADQIENEGYLLTGTSENPETKLRQFTALTTDAYGVRTKQVFFGENATNGKGFIKGSDGTFIFYGEVQNSDNTTDFYVIKTDHYLETIWENKIITAGSNEEASSLIELQDGDYFLLGTSQSTDGTDAVMVKISKSGINTSGIIKSGLKTASNSLGKSMALRSNDRICWIGTNFFPQVQKNPGSSDMSLIFCTDAGLSDAGEFSFGRVGNDVAADVRKAPGGYILLGTSEGINNGGSKILALKTDPNGTLVWEKIIGSERTKSGGVSNQRAVSVEPTKDGGYIILGVTDESQYRGQDGQNFLLVKLDAFGETEWVEVFGGSATDEVSSIRQTKDNGFIIAANITLNNNPAHCLIKTNSRGKLTD